MTNFFYSINLMACLLAATVASPVTAQELDDGAIIAIYNQVNSFDIETGLLGAERGHSKEVRALGAMVARDHSGVRQAVDSLAGEINASLALPASRSVAASDHYAVMTRLLSLSGQEFDRAYLEHEIAFHEAAIEAIKTALFPAAKSKKLTEHFTAVLPAFQGHLDQTRAAYAKLGYEKDNEERSSE
jgi:putative membrane protein